VTLSDEVRAEWCQLDEAAQRMRRATFEGSPDNRDACFMSAGTTRPTVEAVGQAPATAGAKLSDNKESP